MTTEQIKRTQARIGAVQDGFWGPKSTSICQMHLRDLMPKPSPWPATDQASLTEFYGKAGDESKLVDLPAPVTMLYEGKPIRTIRVHWKCAESLKRALIAANAIAPEFVRIYDGCYNFRSMRGSSTPSLHARGAAIDLCAESNGNLVHWPAAATMPIEVMECFAREGWIAAGAFWGRDGMHFQATR